jgi:leucyl-tRNA synthetase
MEEYNSQKIEKKWQKFWEKEKIFEAKDFSKSPKFYILDMFPYPSGAGLHVGHPRGYIGTDIIAHYKRMKGFNVLHPMGWDAFGLPAENYAIKTGIHPSITTKKNIQKFKEQMKLIGLSYDWSREINTTDPDYYKWTQWIFLKLFEMGLAYRKKLPVNWCPKCRAVLANEEVVGGRCERCGAKTTKKEIEQWVLKITDFSKELLDDLDNLDWPKQIKEMQRNWIGKSEGAEIKFQITNSKFKIDVFTTRPDTIFGATFLVLAPEHQLVNKIVLKEQRKEVEEYIEKTKNKSDIERQLGDKKKTGIFTGAYAINPANKKEIPIYVADYVLPYYGYGAIMAVPAHDERDFDFAKKYDLENIVVINKKGIMINSGKFNGMDSQKAGKDIVEWLKEAKPATNYKLRDWVFSRQRYWGEPIPLVFCEECKKKIERGETRGFSKGEIMNPGWIAVNDLPLELPEVEKYQPSKTGESPLSQSKSWLKTKCPKCGNEAKRETNTMPQWAGSCWYFIRYLDINNKKEIVSKKKMDYWLPVDFYVGGAEHAVLHLLYSRFWIKALYKAGVLNFKEPFLKLKTIGLILAPDGQKMSKSKGNVINPDGIVKKYGADTFRIYEMFMGPFDQPIAWDSKGILGAERFLKRVWQIINNLSNKKDSEVETELNRSIKKVSEDIEEQKFNTAIASLMEFLNVASNKGISENQAKRFLKLLAPFAPYLAEELWQIIKNKGSGMKNQEFKSIFQEQWPKYDSKFIKRKTFKLVVQVNGKLRDTVGIDRETSKEEAKKLALKSDKIQKWLENRITQKVVYIKDKLINFVVEE